jgi:hypothetical protein
MNYPPIDCVSCTRPAVEGRVRCVTCLESLRQAGVRWRLNKREEIKRQREERAKLMNENREFNESIIK